jgi:hypothetical protein
MKTKSTRSERLQDLLRGAHHERENLVIEGQWAQQTLRRIRHLAATEHAASTVWFWEPFFWRWFAAGGVATAVMMLLLLNFQFVPDADIWSFLLYENETMNMMQAFLY